MTHTLEQFRGSVSVTDFGAVGDGVTDDTTAIQNALDTSLTVHFPAPASTYAVSGPLSLRTGHTLIGPGQYVDCIAGDGTDTLFETGVVGGSNIRKITIIGLKATNNNHPCVELYNSQEFTIRDCYFSGSSSIVIDAIFSFRGLIQNCKLAASGANTWAISLMNNCNGIIVDGNTYTGGSAGNGLDVGQSQSVTITNNIIESTTTGYGIRVGGNAVGGGICSGVVISGNYLEVVGKPISLAEQYVCYGLDVKGNRIGNENSDADDNLYGILIGRLQNSTINSNVFIAPDTMIVEVDAVDDTATYTITLNGTDFDYPAVGGDLEADILAGLQAVVDASGSYTAAVVSSTLEITLDDAPERNFSAEVSATGTGALSLTAPSFIYMKLNATSALETYENSIVDNYTANQKANYEHDLATASLLVRAYPKNLIKWGDSPPTGVVKCWISDAVDPSVGVHAGNSKGIVLPTPEGGYIDQVELIEASGTLASTIQIGYTSDADEIVNYDPSSASLTSGTAIIPFNLRQNIRTDYALIFRVVAGAGTGTYRVRVWYRN